MTRTSSFTDKMGLDPAPLPGHRSDGGTNAVASGSARNARRYRYPPVPRRRPGMKLCPGRPSRSGSPARGILGPMVSSEGKTPGHVLADRAEPPAHALSDGLRGGEPVADLGRVPAHDILHAVVHGHEEPAQAVLVGPEASGVGPPCRLCRFLVSRRAGTFRRQLAETTGPLAWSVRQA